MASQFHDELLAVETADGVATVKLYHNRLDEANIHVVGEQLLRLVDELDQPELHLDLGEVKYLGSMALAKFVVLHRKLNTAGGHLTLCNVDDAIYEVFQITQLNRIIDVRQKAAS